MEPVCEVVIASTAAAERMRCPSSVPLFNIIWWNRAMSPAVLKRPPSGAGNFAWAMGTRCSPSVSAQSSPRLRGWLYPAAQKECVARGERLENSFRQKTVVRLSGDDFDDAAQSGDSDVAIVPGRSRFEQQGCTVDGSDPLGQRGWRCRATRRRTREARSVGEQIEDIDRPGGRDQFAIVACAGAAGI